MKDKTKSRLAVLWSFELPIACFSLLVVLELTDCALQCIWIVGMENVALRMLLYVVLSGVIFVVGHCLNRHRLRGLGVGLLVYAALMTPRRHVMMALASIMPGWGHVWWLPFACAVGIVGWLMVKRFANRQIGAVFGWLALLCYLWAKMIFSVWWLL